MHSCLGKEDDVARFGDGLVKVLRQLGIGGVDELVRCRKVHLVTATQHYKPASTRRLRSKRDGHGHKAAPDIGWSAAVLQTIAVKIVSISKVR